MSTIAEIRFDPSRLRTTRRKEYGIRFVFGGVVTSLVGLLAQAWGPVVAGLFLAFPSLLPASVTLIESHEGKAAGGSIGLMAFAGIVWAFATRAPAWIVLGCATLSWLVVSMAVWMITQEIAGRLSP
ncbi:MAG TPA: hypothetical protein VF221_18440 [Chloroflexota bacterium]